jgi:hypothetical protein
MDEVALAMDYAAAVNVEIEDLLAAGEKAKLGRVWPHMLHHSCGYYAKLCRTTLATAIPSTRHTTDVLLGVGSRGCGSSGTQRPDPTSWRVCSRAF